MLQKKRWIYSGMSQLVITNEALDQWIEGIARIKFGLVVVVVVCYGRGEGEGDTIKNRTFFPKMDSLMNIVHYIFLWYSLL
jgi:hypothetical protein